MPGRQRQRRARSLKRKRSPSSSEEHRASLEEYHSSSEHHRMDSTSGPAMGFFRWIWERLTPRRVLSRQLGDKNVYPSPPISEEDLSPVAARGLPNGKRQAVKSASDFGKVESLARNASLLTNRVKPAQGLSENDYMMLDSLPSSSPNQAKQDTPSPPIHRGRFLQRHSSALESTRTRNIGKPVYSSLRGSFTPGTPRNLAKQSSPCSRIQRLHSEPEDSRKVLPAVELVTCPPKPTVEVSSDSDAPNKPCTMVDVPHGRIIEPRARHVYPFTTADQDLAREICPTLVGEQGTCAYMDDIDEVFAQSQDAVTSEFREELRRAHYSSKIKKRLDADYNDPNARTAAKIAEAKIQIEKREEELKLRQNASKHVTTRGGTPKDSKKKIHLDDVRKMDPEHVGKMAQFAFIGSPSRQDMQKVAEEIKAGGPGTIIRTYGAIGFTEYDFNRVLNPGEYLNDHTIDTFLNLMCEAASDRARALALDGWEIKTYTGMKLDLDPKSNIPFFLNWGTFFHTAVEAKDPKDHQLGGRRAIQRIVARALKKNGNVKTKEELRQVGYIFVPINEGIHWTLAVIAPLEKTILYYNSLGKPNKVHMQRLADSFNVWLGEDVEWKYVNGFSCQQTNSHDCGVFTCFNALGFMSPYEPGKGHVSQEKMRQGRSIILDLLINVGGFKDRYKVDWYFEADCNSPGTYERRRAFSTRTGH